MSTIFLKTQSISENLLKRIKRLVYLELEWQFNETDCLLWRPVHEANDPFNWKEQKVLQDYIVGRGKNEQLKEESKINLCSFFF